MRDGAFAHGAPRGSRGARLPFAAIESLLLSLSDNDAVLALKLDREQRVVRVNRGFERVSGRTTEAVLGKRWPEDFGVSPVGLDRAHLSGTAVLPSSGAVAPSRTVRWSGSRLPGDDGLLLVGAVVGAPSTADDRTSAIADGRRERGGASSEERLRASEARLRVAQRIAKVGSWVRTTGLHSASGETAVLEYSDELNNIYELDPGKLASYETFLSIVHPDDRECAVRDYWQSLAARVPLERVYRLQMHDGRIKWVRIRCETELDPGGEISRTFGTVQDVTESVLAERELRNHSVVLRSLAEGVQFIDADGVIRFTNPALDAMFGYEPGELVGRPVTDLNAKPEEPEARAARQRALEELGAWDGEFVNRRKDGSVFASRARIRTVDGPTGRIYVAIEQDLTQERIAATSLAENARLETEARYGKALLTELHHRVKNNLQLVASMLRLAFRYASDVPPSATLESVLLRIQAIGMTHEWLSLADVEDIDLEWYLTELVSSITVAHGRSSSVEVAITAHRFRLSAEAFMNLGIIVSELVVNALRHGLAKRTSGRIEVTLTAEGGWAELLVVDDGGGMVPSGGSTLGLRIVEQITERMGGQAAWTDAPGGGTRVVLSFPIEGALPPEA